MSKKIDFSVYTKPSAIGPGVWYFQHLKSFSIEIEDDIRSLYSDIQLIRKRFSCTTCRNHFNEQCEEHDPKIEMESDIKDLKKGIQPEHLAKWLVNAHNNATKKKYERYSKSTGKVFKAEIVPYEQVKEFFTPVMKKGDSIVPCEGDCDSDDEEVVFKIEPVIIDKSSSSKKGSLRLSPRPSSSSHNSSSLSHNSSSSSSSFFSSSNSKKSEVKRSTTVPVKKSTNYSVKVTAYNN